MAESSDRQPGRCPRRRFLASAALSLTSLVTGAALSGCAREEVQTAESSEMAALRKVDPKLLQYRESGKIPTGLHDPRGIAVGRDGTIAVVGDRALALFAADGKARGTAALTFEPQCAAIGGDGLIYVGAADHVEVLDRAGAVQARWQPLGGRALVTAISAGDSDVWVADSGSRTVYRYRKDGSQTGSFGGKDPATGYGGLIVPSPHLDVCAAPDGGVYVSNPGEHRVEHHAADGKMLSSWGVATSDLDGFCGCCNPTDFAIMPEGRFVTAEKGIPRVKVYTAKGKLDCVVAGPDSFASTVLSMDLAALQDGRVLVLDSRQAAIRIFAPAKAST